MLRRVPPCSAGSAGTAVASCDACSLALSIRPPWIQQVAMRAPSHCRFDQHGYSKLRCVLPRSASSNSTAVASCYACPLALSVRPTRMPQVAMRAPSQCRCDQHECRKLRCVLPRSARSRSTGAILGDSLVGTEPNKRGQRPGFDCSPGRTRSRFECWRNTDPHQPARANHSAPDIQ